MPVTLTIKQVPERLAQKLRARAAANHRSLQGELMLILHNATADSHVAEQETPKYHVKQTPMKKVPVHGRRLTLKELWQRSRTLGRKSRSESTSIIRELRDERHGR